MSKDLQTSKNKDRHYQKTKKKFQKGLLKDIKSLLKKKKSKTKNQVENDIRISKKMKNKGQLSTKKDIMIR